ncbi:MAG: Ig-like domain-containing protein, partial [Beijerinckiaceae bacterium]
RSLFLVAMIISGNIFSVLPADAACNTPSWRFRWGPSPTLVTLNITEGSTCGNNINLSGAEKLNGIGIVSQGSKGRVSTTARRFEYRPNPGFKGADSFSVELRGSDAWGQPVTNTLNVTVNVQ